MTSEKRLYRKLDWSIIICYLLLSLFGWLNIYAATYSEETGNIFSLANRSGTQAIWILTGLIVAAVILFFLNSKIIQGFSWLSYLAVTLLLVAVLVFGREVNGAKSWLILGPFALQPSEFSKISTALCLSFVMSRMGFKLSNISDFAKAAAVIIFPVLLIALEPDIGTILVYCGLAFVFYREQMSGLILAYAGFTVLLFLITLKFSPLASMLTVVGCIGIIRAFTVKHPIPYIIGYLLFIVASAFIPDILEIKEVAKINLPAPEYILSAILLPIAAGYAVKHYKNKAKYPLRLLVLFVGFTLFILSTEVIFDKILKPHHRDRIENLLGITSDLKGAGYNVHQSRIAIGSGGLTGKGFLNGTQTKFNFVPEQSTDFIFCTVGEEWGFAGSAAVLLLFFFLILRIILSAEKHREAFTRIYGYCVASYLFMHVFVNVGMTIGIMPVVGIPLPFLSYGGSSFLSFTILLFIYLRLDVEKWQ